MAATIQYAFRAHRPAQRAALLLASATVALSAATTAATAELKVTVTMKPVHALVAQVMEGVGTPELLIKGAASPHTYAMKPSDARALHKANVFFRVSETVEPFTRKIVTALPKSVRTVTLADAPGVEHLPIRSGDTFEAHDHAHAHKHDAGHKHGHAHDHGYDHNHDHGHDHHADETTAKDGHVWLDPANARRMVAEIARVLIEASPEHADKLRANAERADSALEALQSELAQDLTPLKGKPYVVFHDAYQYFERRFDLKPVGSITVSPEQRPSAKRLTEIRKKLASLGASCVFAEPQFQPKLVAAVIEGTGARSGTLDPEGALVTPGPDAYTTLLRNLAAGLKSCLANPS